uniref:Uncharacterized protein n=1 Tax=Monopterus albus TaxID=43700 RepID=A0A3Q3Q5Y7_MONAL
MRTHTHRHMRAHTGEYTPTSRQRACVGKKVTCVRLSPTHEFDWLAEAKNHEEVILGLEHVHQGTTIGSLAGVVLVLAPFTFGTSLIVTGVGVGVSTLGGVTAGASNITKMVNQSSDRKAVRSSIKEFKEKINAVVTWLQEICNSLQAIRDRFQTADVPDNMDISFSEEQLARLGFRVGRAQASRVVRVSEAVTGVLSGLFVAVDLFFIAMDAKEIHHIRQAKAAEERTTSQPGSETETEDSVSTFDKAVLVVKESGIAMDNIIKYK